MLSQLLAESSGHFWQPEESEDVANPNFENLNRLQKPGILLLTEDGMFKTRYAVLDCRRIKQVLFHCPLYYKRY